MGIGSNGNFFIIMTGGMAGPGEASLMRLHSKE